MRSRLVTPWAWARIVMSLVIVLAIATQVLDLQVEAAAAAQSFPARVANYFSYFTVLSNLLGAIGLGVAGLWRLTRGRDQAPEPVLMTALLNCATVCLTITGLVYNTILRADDPTHQGFVWTNEVLHVVAPVFLLVDLALALGRRKAPWGSVALVIGMPLVWLVYTLVRGELVRDPLTQQPFWYPYDFLNPHLQPTGWAGVAINLAVILIIGLALSALAVAWTRKRSLPAPGQ